MRAFLAWLPRGRALPCAAWRTRHRGLRALLWVHVPVLLVVGALLGQTDGHALLHGLPLVLCALLAHWDAVPQRLQALAVSVGLLTAAALGVHVSGGVTEAHFLFFVLLIGLALYEDWLIFLLSIGYVVVHHGLASTVGLGEVYSHAGDNSWQWAALHGAFVLLAAGLCVIAWRASEQARFELQVAERAKLESQLREAQKLESLGLLAGGVAHDFNNLLVGVLGNAALLREDLPPESPLSPYIEQIEQAGQRAATLTRQMLAYAGESRLELAPVDVSGLVAETATLTSPAIGKTVRLELTLETERSTSVHGDGGQLAQVVMNLITNAAESLAGGEGRVAVRTGVEPDEAHVFIEVEDTGCGMSSETQARMFDPFYTTKFTGRGLGLAAVAGIVRSHGGTIEARSEVGVGTTFRVVLPLSRVPAEAAPMPVSPPPVGNGRVLVVDDEQAVRDVARRMLERSGYEVIVAASGIEAVERLRGAESTIEVAIVDMNMPGLNGLETMRALRLGTPSLPVILSSGYTTQTLETGLPAGTRFIQKPYANRELLELLRDVRAVAAAA